MKLKPAKIYKIPSRLVLVAIYTHNDHLVLMGCEVLQASALMIEGIKSSRLVRIKRFDYMVANLASKLKQVEAS